MIKEIIHNKELQEKIQLASTTNEELKDMSYKDKQKIFKAKNELCKVFHRGGTYIKERK